MLETQVNKKVDDPRMEIDTLKPKENEYMPTLMNQNRELTEKNELLQERLNNLQFVASVLNTKNKDLENEKASYITALKILQADNREILDDKSVKEINQQKREVAQKSSKRDRPKSAAKGNKQTSTKQNNKFVVLGDENEDEETQVGDDQQNARNSSGLEQERVTPASKNSARKGETTLIIWDSIIGQVNNWIIGQVNNLISKFCRQRTWGLVRHNNITTNHLNSYGLHLNKAGSSVFAKTAINYFNSSLND